MTIFKEGNDGRKRQAPPDNIRPFRDPKKKKKEKAKPQRKKPDGKTEQAKKRRQEQKERPEKSGRSATPFFATLAVILLLLGGLVFFGNLKEVTIDGNEIYEESVIKEAVLNDDFSWNTFYVFVKYRFVETDPLPFIDTMEVELTGAHSLNIRVYEKGILGYLEIEDQQQYAYFDKDGLVEELSDRIIPGIPRIEGIACEKAELYEKLPIENRDLRSILVLTQALKRYELQPETITYGVQDAPVLTYGTIRVNVGNGAELTRKLERLAAILQKVQGKSGVIHLEDWTETTADIVFTMDTGDKTGAESPADNESSMTFENAEEEIPESDLQEEAPAEEAEGDEDADPDQDPEWMNDLDED